MIWSSLIHRLIGYKLRDSGLLDSDELMDCWTLISDGLTDLEDPGDGALVQQPHALAVGGVLVVQGEAAPGPGAAGQAGAAVHPDVALVPGEGPVHQPLLSPGSILCNGVNLDRKTVVTAQKSSNFRRK